MTRVGGMVCAVGAICLGLAGCQGLRDFDWAASAFLSPYGNDRVVTGSLETVSASTQNALRDLGLFTSVSRDGETVRITTSTKSGDKVTLVLSRQKSDSGERTRIHFDWTKGRDENLELQILGKAGVPGRS